MLDRDPVGKGDLRAGGIIIKVIDLAVTDGLDIRVLRGLNGQSALIKRLKRLCLGITFLIDQCPYHLICQLVHKVRVDAALITCDIDKLYPVVHIVRERFIVLLLRDVLMPEHVVENFQAPLCIVLRV